MEGGRLSDVTANKLEQRRCEMTTHYSKGVRNVGHFKGSIRAMEVACGGHFVWTAETDGTIAVRHGMSGAVVNTIARKRDVFVCSLLSCGPFMWVGLSDGFLRIYNTEAKDLLNEIRQHAGAITCFTELGGRIYSGSTDRQIFSWDSHLPQKPLPKGAAPFISQLSGHQNSIRCFAADDRFLYSAGDDCSIRCWDVDTSKEKRDLWPIYGHKSAVAALQVHELHLFSASHDCTVKVWNTQTGALLKTLDLHTGPVSCLLKDSANSRIWSGGTDGVIGVWDAEALTLVTKMHDHANTFVSSMRLLSRVHAMKAWSVGGNGVVRVWYFESDPTGVDQAQQDSIEGELQAKIESMRSTIIQNYQELELKKEQLKRLETAEDRRRKELAAAMGRLARAQVLRHHWLKLLEWNSLQRRVGRRSELASLLARNTHLGTLSVYFHKLAAYNSRAKEAKRKMEVAYSLARVTERSLASIYMRKLVDCVQIFQNRKKKRMIAQALLVQTTRGFQSVYYNKWRRWLELQKATQKRAFIADALVRNNEKAFIALHYQKLLAFAQQEQRREQGYLLASNIATVNARPLQQYYFSKLFRWARRRRAQPQKEKVAQTLERSSACALSARYFRKWLSWQQRASVGNLQNKLQEKTHQLDQLRRLVDQHGSLGDEEARHQLHVLQQQLAESRERLFELQQQNTKLRTASRIIGSELRLNNLASPQREAQGSPGQHPAGGAGEELRHSVGYLKARVVNVMADFQLIVDVKERVKRGLSPVSIFLSAHGEVKRLVVEVTQSNQLPGQEWALTAEQLARIPGHSCRAALAAIKEMAIVFDFIPPHERDDLETAEEVVRNFHWLEEIAQVAIEHLEARRGHHRRPTSAASPPRKTPPSGSTAPTPARSVRSTTTTTSSI